MDANTRRMVIFPETEERLVRTARERMPYEACGVVYGRREGDATIAIGFGLIRNASSDPERAFTFHPEDWVRAYGEAQKNQREIVGLFHAHPYRQPKPGAIDRLGSIPWGTYWIIGLFEDRHSIAVYLRDRDDRWTSLPILRGE